MASPTCDTLRYLRGWMRGSSGTPLPGVVTDQLVINGAPGPLRARRYRPASREPAAARLGAPARRDPAGARSSRHRPFCRRARRRRRGRTGARHPRMAETGAGSGPRTIGPRRRRGVPARRSPRAKRRRDRRGAVLWRSAGTSRGRPPRRDRPRPGRRRVWLLLRAVRRHPVRSHGAVRVAGAEPHTCGPTPTAAGWWPRTTFTASRGTRPRTTLPRPWAGLRRSPETGGSCRGIRATTA